MQPALSSHVGKNSLHEEMVAACFDATETTDVARGSSVGSSVQLVVACFDATGSQKLKLTHVCSLL